MVVVPDAEATRKFRGEHPASAPTDILARVGDVYTHCNPHVNARVQVTIYHALATHTK